MTDFSHNWAEVLNEAIALTKDLKTHDEARAKFVVLKEALANEKPEMVALLNLLWEECISAQRGAAFWKEMSDAEKALADDAMKQSIQSKQNYMRLMQEM